MPDDMDFCQQINEELIDDALAAHRRRNQAAGESRAECLDCEEPIPPARQQAVPGCQRCVDCQTLHEHWRAL